MARQVGKFVWPLLLILLLSDFLTIQPVRPTKSNAGLALPSRNSILLMDTGGNYRIAIGHDQHRGIHRNEVAKQFPYVERIEPYMVQYRADTQGYQPELIATSVASVDSTDIPTPNYSTAPMDVTSRSSAKLLYSNRLSFGQTPTLRTPNDSNQLSPFSATLSASSTLDGTQQQPSFQFVQNALRTMQTLPLRMSFNSMHDNLLQSPVTNTATSDEVVAVKPPATLSIARTKSAAAQISIDRFEELTSASQLKLRRPLIQSFHPLDRIEHGQRGHRAGISILRKNLNKINVYDRNKSNIKNQNIGANSFLSLDLLAAPKLSLNSHFVPLTKMPTPQLVVSMKQLSGGSYDYTVKPQS